MALLTVNKITGLYPASGALSAPQGALLRADNCVIRTPGVLEPRRGFQLDETVASKTASVLFFFDGAVFSYNTDATVTRLEYGRVASAQATLGTIAAPAGTPRMRFVQAGSSVYANAVDGLYKIASATTAPVMAGAPSPSEGYGDYPKLSTSGSSGHWMSGPSTVAYRYVLGYRDSGGREVWGAPSGRVVVRNTDTVTTNKYYIDHQILIPSGGAARAGILIRVFRSEVATGSDSTPPDELYLVHEGVATPGAAYVWADKTPEAMLTIPLYTNPATGRGELAANDLPPAAMDTALWQNRLWMARTTQPHTYELQLLGADTVGDGLRNADTITITISGTPTVFTAQTTAPTPGTGQFQVFTSSSNLPSTNTRDTALSLVRQVNARGIAVKARYMSYADDPDGEGKILLYAASPSASGFSVSTSRANAWNPNPLGDSAQSYRPNRIYYSPIGEYEGFPRTNYIDIGPEDQDILRILPLRDKMLVATEGGWAMISGQYPFRVDWLDRTAILLAPDSAAELGGQIYCLSTQGVISVSDAGVAVVSRGVKDSLSVSDEWPVAGKLADVAQYSFGFGYESENQYWLFLIGYPSTQGTASALVYNYLAGAWTSVTLPARTRTAAVVPNGTVSLAVGLDTDDTIVFLSDGAGYSLYKELKFRSGVLEYADDYGGATITSVSADGRTLTLDSVATATVGSAVVQGGNKYGMITAVNAGPSTITVDQATGDSGAFANGAVTFYKPITCVVEFFPNNAGSPGSLKQFSDATFHFAGGVPPRMTLSFASDAAPDAITEAWQDRTDGVISYAQTFLKNGRPRNVRAFIPRSLQHCSAMSVGFTVAQGGVPWRLGGYSLEVTGGTSGRTNR